MFRVPGFIDAQLNCFLSVWLQAILYADSTEAGPKILEEI